MVAENLAAYRPEIRRHEGGLVNHPNDPGGLTNIGITQRVYDAHRDRVNLARQTVANISDSEVDTIYNEEYWHRIHGDELPAGIDTSTLDSAINSGVRQGSKWLQRALGVNADGIIGLVETVPAAHAAPDKVAVIKEAARRRLNTMMLFGNWETFKKGWTRRVAEVEAFSVNLWLSSTVSPTSRRAANLNEAESANKSRKRNRNVASTAGTTGAAECAIVVEDQFTGQEAVVVQETPSSTSCPEEVFDLLSLSTSCPEEVIDPAWSVLDSLLTGGFVITILVAGYFLWLAHVQKERRDAYELAATGVMDHGIR